MIFITLVVQGFSLPLLIKLLGVKPSANEDKEEKELQLFVVNSTLHFIEYEFYPLPVRKELISKYEQLAGKLIRFSDTAIRQVERDMDIDELKLNQLLPKEDQ